jgi:hypothetical protein
MAADEIIHGRGRIGGLEMNVMELRGFRSLSVGNDRNKHQP